MSSLIPVSALGGKFEERSIIKTNLGRTSYDFGFEFCKKAGIEARLNTESHACVDENSFLVSFKYSGFPVGDITFAVQAGHADLGYNRVISREEEIFEHADLWRVMQKTAQNAGYIVRWPGFGPARELIMNIGVRVDTKNYLHHAQQLGAIHQILLSLCQIGLLPAQ